MTDGAALPAPSGATPCLHPLSSVALVSARRTRDS
jgi:hypothetical protein